MTEREEMPGEEVVRNLSEIITQLGYESNYELISSESKSGNLWAIDSPCLMCGVKSNMSYSRDGHLVLSFFNPGIVNELQMRKEEVLAAIRDKVPVSTLELKQMDYE